MRPKHVMNEHTHTLNDSRFSVKCDKVYCVCIDGNNNETEYERCVTWDRIGNCRRLSNVLSPICREDEISLCCWTYKKTD
jgi:hypothetical protein